MSYRSPRAWLIAAEIAIFTGVAQNFFTQGNFFEGVLTSGAASTVTTDAVQANIVAAGYGM